MCRIKSLQNTSFLLRMTAMRKSILLIFCLLLSLGSFAQSAASYSFSYSSGTYTPLSGGTSVSILADDITVIGIPIGFTFTFCGTNYTSVAVCSNGWLSFNTGITTATTALGNTTANLSTITPAVMPLWDDLDGRATTGGVSSASYLTTGSSPNRVFTMEWSEWEWNYLSNASMISFQVKLYEGTNIVRCTYTPSGSTAPSTPSATIGIAGSGSDYQNLNNSSTTPTSVIGTFIDTIKTKPAAGQIYEWTPPPPCSGTPSAGTASATPNPACPNVPFILNSVGYTGRLQYGIPVAILTCRAQYLDEYSRRYNRSLYCSRRHYHTHRLSFI